MEYGKELFEDARSSAIHGGKIAMGQLEQLYTKIEVLCERADYKEVLLTCMFFMIMYLVYDRVSRGRDSNTGRGSRKGNSDAWYNNLSGEDESRVKFTNSWGYKTMRCDVDECIARATFGHVRGGVPICCRTHSEGMVKSFGCKDHSCNRKHMRKSDYCTYHTNSN